MAPCDVQICYLHQIVTVRRSVIIKCVQICGSYMDYEFNDRSEITTRVMYDVG